MADSFHRQRDLVILESTHKFDKSILVLGTSTTLSPFAETKKYVRAYLKFSAWILEQHGSDTILTYILQTDVRGFIPQGLVKKYMVKRVESILNIRRMYSLRYEVYLSIYLRLGVYWIGVTNEVVYQVNPARVNIQKR